MNAFTAAAILIVLAAALGYLNHRVFRLPHTIGLVVMGAVASLVLVGVDRILPSAGLGDAVSIYLKDVDFHDALINGMLSFLLFAGALHVDLDALLQRHKTVISLATIGVLISTAIVGFAFYGLTRTFGFDVPLIWCFVFGALISPTDPVAVIGVLKAVKVPPKLEATVAGESLFNDGVTLVAFSLLVAAATGKEAFSAGHALELFAIETGGGIAFGLAAGALVCLAIRGIDDYNLEIIITLALVMGGYTLAEWLGISGPIAMAVAGLLIGNHGTKFAMSAQSRQRVTEFWELIDEILNSALFLLIGLEVVTIDGEFMHLALGVAAIVVVLVARAASVALPLAALTSRATRSRGSFQILVWGGVRGGISIALALSLPDGDIRETLLTATYIVVAFSVIVQGSTISHAVRRFVHPIDPT